MSFENPGFLAALLLVPLAGLFVYWADKQRQRALARLGNPGLLARLSKSVNWRGRKWRTALWLAALALLIVSIARPQWGSEAQQVDQEGLQVMVALDVSQSMLVEDVKPNRLARAKLEIQDRMQKSSRSIPVNPGPTIPTNRPITGPASGTPLKTSAGSTTATRTEHHYLYSTATLQAPSR